jgi:hypothetical protein
MLADTGIVSHSAKAAGVSRKTVYEYRNNCSEFSRRWDEAEQRGLDMLEDIARKRAMQSSDGLIMFLLKHKRPMTYNPPAQAQVQMDVANLSDDELQREIADLEARILAASTAGGNSDS